MRHSVPAIALALCCAWPAAALDLPPRKAGLWELQTTLDDLRAPPRVMQQCIDAATDKLMSDNFDSGQDICARNEIRKSGSAIVAESSCKTGDVATTTRATYDGNFDSAYTVKVSMIQEGGAAGPPRGGTTNMTIEAKWMGPCKAGQKPGDIEMPGGTKMNVLELHGMPNVPQR